MLPPKQVHTQIQSRPGKDPRAESSWIGDVSPAGTLCAARAPLAPLPPLVHTAPGPPLGKRNYFRNLKHNVLNSISSFSLLKQTQTISEQQQLSHLRRRSMVGQVAPLNGHWWPQRRGRRLRPLGKTQGPTSPLQNMLSSRILEYSRIRV